MNKFYLLLSLSFCMASLADLQAYRCQEAFNKGLAKGEELFEFVKNSRNAQIGLAIASSTLVLGFIAYKLISSKKPNSAQQEKASDKDLIGEYGAPQKPDDYSADEAVLHLSN